METIQFEDRPIMKCGCVAMAIESSTKRPACVTHDCMEIAESQPSFKNRMARCAYYGKTVKRGGYNSNCCDKCANRYVCECEEESSPDLWFFVYRPKEKFDEFYCACQGAD